MNDTHKMLVDLKYKTKEISNCENKWLESLHTQ